MARNVSDEELQLKKRARRRLVGAIVLVTAVAVVLPMVLDSEPKPVNQNINIQIPSPDAGVLSSSPTPLKPAAPATDPVAPSTGLKPAEKAVPVPAPAAMTESKPVAAAPAEPKAETKSEPKPAAQPEPKAEVKPEPKTEVKPKPVTKSEPTKQATKAKDGSTKEKPKSVGGFAIQVAALADAAKAKELQAKIAGSGMKAYTEVVQTAKGPVTRVRVGPYASREAAEKARQQLQRLQLDGKVVPR